ncbi:hypothetical protein AABB24_023937 [Solanum stoloniferum]|uniref:Uncharacterized protein n=1 Tax=Solanum stoloniferum TaxID=62892 RepID=A0ABD2SLR9_9SOLN
MDEQGNHTIVTRIFLRFQMYFVCTLVVISLSNFCVFFSKIPLTPFGMRRRDVYIGEILGFKLEGKRVKLGFESDLIFKFFPQRMGKSCQLLNIQTKSLQIRMKYQRGLMGAAGTVSSSREGEEIMGSGVTFGAALS